MKAKAVHNNAIVEFDLQKYRGKYVVLVFYPLDFTFVCPTELIAFSDRLEEFQNLGAEVVGISVDSEYTHLAWARTPRDQGGLDPIRIPLVADLNKNIARSFGVLHDESVALRGMFILDGKGVVRHSTVNDLGIGRSVDEALRLVQAIQFNDQHGEVCPANWKPGAKSVFPQC